MANNKYTYVLRTCSEDMLSYNGFKWPREGQMKCDDWEPTAKCGNGLHGLLMGTGDGSLLNWEPTAQWLVVKVLTRDVVEIDQSKVKFPKGTVVFCGGRKEATDYIISQGADASKVVGAFITVGDGSVGSGYHYSTVSGGDGSTVSGGHRSTVSGEDYSTVSGGDYSTVSGGYNSTVSGGIYSTVSGGNDSTVSGGHDSTVSGGDYSTVSGGNYSIVSGGDYSTVSGGGGSILQVKWFDGKRFRIAVSYIGEDGIKPNTKYKVTDNGKFVEVK